MQNMIKAMQSMLNQAEAGKKSAEDALKKEKEQYAADRDELAMLRSALFYRSEAGLSQEKQQDEEASDVYEASGRIIIYGGHETWKAHMQKMLKGDVTYAGASGNVNTAGIPTADLVVFQTNCIAHSAYYKVVDIAKRNGVPILYLTSASAANGVDLIRKYEKDPKSVYE